LVFRGSPSNPNGIAIIQPKVARKCYLGFASHKFFNPEWVASLVTIELNPVGVKIIVADHHPA
jgi:hypothetical protein